MNPELIVVYNTRLNKIGLLVDQFVMHYEAIYIAQVGRKNLQIIELESMVEFADDWHIIGDF